MFIFVYCWSTAVAFNPGPQGSQSSMFSMSPCSNIPDSKEWTKTYRIVSPRTRVDSHWSKVPYFVDYSHILYNTHLINVRQVIYSSHFNPSRTDRP